MNIMYNCYVKHFGGKINRNCVYPYATVQGVGRGYFSKLRLF